MTTDAGGNSRGANLVFAEDVRDHVGDVVELHDLAIDDGVGLEVFESEVQKLQSSSLFAELNSLHRTRTDVETNEVLFSGAFFEHVSYSSPQRSAICVAGEAEHALFGLGAVGVEETLRSGSREFASR